MNGPEHYREAERLIVAANDVETSIANLPESQHVRAYRAIKSTRDQAQVHATLALAAATALADYPASYATWLETATKGLS